MFRIAIALTCLCSVSSGAIALRADDAKPTEDQPPHKRLLYPSKVERIDYLGQSGDEFHVTTRMATADDFETVVAFYGEKLGRQLDPRKNQTRVGGGKPPLVDVVTDDNHPVDPDDPFLNFRTDEERGVKLKCYVLHTGTEHITLVISQARGEACTHILLTHIQQSAQEM